MLSGENHDVRWIAAHERLKSYGCDQKAAALLPASKLEARVRVRLKHLKMLQSTKSKAHFSSILGNLVSLLYKKLLRNWHYLKTVQTNCTFFINQKVLNNISVNQYCLKIAKISVELFNFGLFHQFLSYLNCPVW